MILYIDQVDFYFICIVIENNQNEWIIPDVNYVKAYKVVICRCKC